MNQFENILNQGIGLYTLIPLLAFFVSLVWKNRQENPLAWIVLFTKAFYIIVSVGYAILWIINGATPVNVRAVTLYETEHFVFAIQFWYDHITAVYSIVGAILFFLVSTFSRYYMHRDEGFKRFFNTILLFAVGYNLIIFSGNFETMFVGWEIIGLSSFLLIAFYRNRYLPVKNAFKTISNYRISDVALMLAMWMMHHLTHQNISFDKLANAAVVAEENFQHGMAVFIVVMILLAALIKSAQFPFTSWLPRAMEGPTSSSAIFYGSLSVHIGVFLLLRTYPFWQHMEWVKIMIIIFGALTGIIATAIARVQPTVKTQIAYSSAAQIGIIFIEVALGFHVLALIHFAGNAFLRTYQLLVSPSVLNYLVHHQYFHYHPQEDKPLSKTKAALYILAVKEWNLDTIMSKYLWRPFKWIGTQVRFMQSVPALVFVLGLSIAAFYFYYEPVPFIRSNHDTLSLVLIALGFLMSLAAFASRQSALSAWFSLFFSQVLIIAGVMLNAGTVYQQEFTYYISGILIAFFIGLFCLLKTRALDNDITLNKFHGYVYEQKLNAFIFLVAAVGLLGFPVTAAFIGIDVFFTYIDTQQYPQIVLLGLSFIFIELAALRVFLRIYCGPHKKLDHPVAYRSS